MFKKIVKILTAPTMFIAASPAYLITVGSERAIEAKPPRAFRRCWYTMLLMAIAWGLGTVGLWGGAWFVFPEPVHKLAFIPLLVAAAITLWPMQRSIVASCSIFGGGKLAAGRTSAIVLTIIAGCFLSLPHRFTLPEFPMPWSTAWLRPDFETYRVLLLMPLWGWWAMIFTCQFNRRGENTCPAIREMSAGYGPAIGTLTLAVPMLATAVNFSYLYWLHLVISFATAIVAIVGGIVFCRKSGGVTRDAMLATNLVAQMTFLLAFTCCPK